MPPIIVLAGSGYIPFSPRWLLSKGRREEAFDVVKRLHRTPDDKEDVAARQEFYLMEKQYELDAQFVMRPFEIFRTAPNRRRSLMPSSRMVAKVSDKARAVPSALVQRICGIWSKTPDGSPKQW